MDVLAHEVVGAAYEVSNTLGAGFLEKMYERAMLRELSLRGLAAETQILFSVMYKGQRVDDYFADLVVEDRLVVELKCVDDFSNAHIAQSINYLKAPGLKLSLLINFKKPKVQWKRIIHDPQHSRPFAFIRGQ